MDEANMTDDTYNGWTNYETWAVNLWIGNEQGPHEYWREQARTQRAEATNCQQVEEGIWTADRAAVFNLADQLREEISDGSPLRVSSLYSDLLGAALSEVNWQEIAEHMLADLEEEDEPASDLFGPVIFSYSRAQAIADGVLIDVTETAKEAGIKHPTALTAAVWAEYVEVPAGVECQDEQGRLWDILNMFRFAAKQSAGGTELRFEVLVRNDNTSPKPVTLKAICGPGDTLDPVLTILLPDED